MFVLVHGAWHGGWCWEQVESNLRRDGADTIAVDLPGRAGDARTVGQLTLEDYVDTVVGALETSPEPSVLVGHSLGGLVISQTAERVPDKVAHLVYLCALLLGDGGSVLDLMASEADSLLMASVNFDGDAGVSFVSPDAVRELFYADCSDDVSTRAAGRLVGEPIAPSSTPLQVSAERWGSVPRTYVVCTEDRAISEAAQRRMIDQVGVNHVVELSTSHSPFLSEPERLATLLAEIPGSRGVAAFEA